MRRSTLLSSGLFSFGLSKPPMRRSTPTRRSWRPSKISKPPMRRSTGKHLARQIADFSKPPMRRSTARRASRRIGQISKPPMRRSTTVPYPWSETPFSKPPMRRSTLWKRKRKTRYISKPPMRWSTALNQAITLIGWALPDYLRALPKFLIGSPALILQGLSNYVKKRVKPQLFSRTQVKRIDWTSRKRKNHYFPLTVREFCARKDGIYVRS